MGELTTGRTDRDCGDKLDSSASKKKQTRLVRSVDDVSIRKVTTHLPERENSNFPLVVSHRTTWKDKCEIKNDCANAYAMSTFESVVGAVGGNKRSFAIREQLYLKRGSISQSLSSLYLLCLCLYLSLSHTLSVSASLLVSLLARTVSGMVDSNAAGLNIPCSFISCRLTSNS